MCLLYNIFAGEIILQVTTIILHTFGSIGLTGQQHGFWPPFDTACRAGRRFRKRKMSLLSDSSIRAYKKAVHFPFLLPGGIINYCDCCKRVSQLREYGGVKSQLIFSHYFRQQICRGRDGGRYLNGRHNNTSHVYYDFPQFLLREDCGYDSII